MRAYPISPRWLGILMAGALLPGCPGHLVYDETDNDLGPISVP